MIVRTSSFRFPRLCGLGGPRFVAVLKVRRRDRRKVHWFFAVGDRLLDAQAAKIISAKFHKHARYSGWLAVAVIMRLSESELGQHILRLRREKDELTDVVWLATSTSQVRDLWSRVAELLNDAPTQLKRDAMAIEPASDE